MTGSIEIVEVSPRDGLQNDATLVSTDDKLKLIERAVAAGVRRIEATSFVNPKRVPQMADAADLMVRVPRDRGVTYIGLALNQRGAERAIEAGCDEINYVVVASETFNQRNNGAAIAETMGAWPAIARMARVAGVGHSITIGASFGCPFEGEVPAARVIDIARQAADQAPREIALADTIGVGVPPQVSALLHGVRDAVGRMPLRCHFHNTRNTGFANAVAAIGAGAATLDASIGGVGGCPFAPAATGNIATEDLVYMLNRMDVATGLSLEALTDAADWLEGVLGHDIPGQVRRAGAFPEAAARIAAA
ncbi:MAG: hydroxymethylglutaryl-CoA lyase [Inquilinaceae bacterium]